MTVVKLNNIILILLQCYQLTWPLNIIEVSLKKFIIIKLTRMLQLQATVKRFQFDLYVNLEGQHMLINSWSQR